jgi:hypothetical protein
MAVVWCCVLACALANALWLPYSTLSFVPSNWPPLIQSASYVALVGILVALAFHRLRGDASRIGGMPRTALVTTELLYRTALPIVALLTAGATLSYVTTAANLPLRDSLLARAEHSDDRRDTTCRRPSSCGCPGWCRANLWCNSSCAEAKAHVPALRCPFWPTTGNAASANADNFIIASTTHSVSPELSGILLGVLTFSARKWVERTRPRGRGK